MLAVNQIDPEHYEAVKNALAERGVELLSMEMISTTTVQIAYRRIIADPGERFTMTGSTAEGASALMNEVMTDLDRHYQDR
jgi:hypothetical protein